MPACTVEFFNFGGSGSMVALEPDPRARLLNFATQDLALRHADPLSADGYKALRLGSRSAVAAHRAVS